MKKYINEISCDSDFILYSFFLFLFTNDFRVIPLLDRYSVFELFTVRTTLYVQGRKNDRKRDRWMKISRNVIYDVK